MELAPRNDIVYINGKMYKVRMLYGWVKVDSSNEWDDFVDDFKSDDSIIHWKYMESICDSQDGRVSGYISRGFKSSKSWSLTLNSAKAAYIGFRPVLEPLEDDALHFIADGSIVRYGTLLMNGVPIKNPKHPVYVGDIPNYIAGTKIRIGSTSSDPDNQIRWIKWRGLLVADRNILKNISWNQLNALGFIS